MNTVVEFSVVARCFSLPLSSQLPLLLLRLEKSNATGSTFGFILSTLIKFIWPTLQAAAAAAAAATAAAAAAAAAATKATTKREGTGQLCTTGVGDGGVNRPFLTPTIDPLID
jgi:hypothetical protein